MDAVDGIDNFGGLGQLAADVGRARIDRICSEPVCWS